VSEKFDLVTNWAVVGELRVCQWLYYLTIQPITRNIIAILFVLGLIPHRPNSCQAHRPIDSKI